MQQSIAKCYQNAFTVYVDAPHLFGRWQENIKPCKQVGAEERTVFLHREGRLFLFLALVVVRYI